MTRYSLYKDFDRQRFVIEDERGNVLAIKDMPWSKTPASSNELMERPENKEAWERLWDLVELANKGIAA